LPLVSHALQVFAGHAHSGGKCADNTITCFVNGVKFFTAKNALRQSLAELSDNRTRFLSVSPESLRPVETASVIFRTSSELYPYSRIEAAAREKGLRYLKTRCRFFG
jgi:hypothetical protein